MEGEPAPGGGGPPAGDPPAFDPKAFQSALMVEVNKAINGSVTRFEKLVEKFKPAEPVGGGEGDKGGEVDKGGKPKDPEVLRLLKTVETLNKTVETERSERIKATEAGREKERLSLIRTELAKQGLADHAVDDAFRFFRDEVKYTESGDLVGGADELPLAEFVKGVVEKRTHWLPPVPAGGAGATTGRGGKGAPAASLDDIGMHQTKEQRAATYAAIQRALGR
jgi:hypothetical protein